jgi:uncharacterized protein
MPDTDLTTERSMDEILKKIERKLVEEDKPEDAAAGSMPQSAEVLKLADAAGDNRKGRAQARGRPASGVVAGAPGNETARSGPEGASLTEADVGEIAARALALARTQPEPAALGDPTTPETLEDVVRELVKPMLRSWLDAKLGEILNRLVQAELNKALEEVSAS